GLVIRTDNVVIEAIDQDLLLITEHHPGVKNKKVDALSHLAREGDYTVKKQYLYLALAELELNVRLDAFATRTNTHLTEYFTLSPNHREFAVNAFSTNWKNLMPLLYPPIPLKHRTLVKVQKGGTEAVIILPDWKRQIWEQLLKEISVTEIVLGQADEVLEKGKTMDILILQHSPEKTKAVRLISLLKEKDFSNEWPNMLDLMKTPLIT
ncbi:MAG: hypothetical protein EZS28_053469, partial [Streblomastix strix]